jgi:hypothetical protein
VSVCNLHTARSRVVLEKLTGLQLFKKFPAFYGTERFITAFTSAHHLSLSWASSIQSLPPYPTSWRSISILSSHLRLGLPSGLRFSHQNPVYSSSLPIRSTCPVHLILDFITRTILGNVYRSLSPTLCSFHLVPLRPKYSPQLPILRHLQPTFHPRCERPSFIPIQNRPQSESWKL